jgi:hypothetical protein
VCFSDDSINICGFNGNALKISKQFNPLKLKEKYLLKSNKKIEIVEFFYDSDEPNEDNMIRNGSQDYRRGIISDVMFTDSGNHCLISGFDGTLNVFATAFWEVKRIIRFQNLYLKRIEFLPQPDSSTKLLVAQASNHSLIIFNLNSINTKLPIQNSHSYKFSLSSNFLANVLTSGEIYVYNLDYHLALIRKSCNDALLVNDLHEDTVGILRTNKSNMRLNQIQNEVITF